MMNGSDNNGTASVLSTRKTIEMVLPDGRVYTGARGATLLEMFKMLPEWEMPPIMGAVVNGELRELTYTLEMDARVRPVTMAEDDGSRIYRRTLTFIMEAAFEELFPDSQMTLDHSVSAGGYYCDVVDREPLSEADLKHLEARMHELIQADLTISKKNVSLKEATEYFQKKGYQDKVRLLKYRQKEYLVLYELGNHRDYHHGYMLPSTGFCKWFSLYVAGDGFVLSFPRKNTPTQILPAPSYPMLLSAFRQYGNWLNRLGIESVGALNDANASGNMREVVLISEALHELQISEIAQQIADRADDARIILIAGPSSSGKTTFSKRLAIQLLAHGFAPYPLEMDNYFVDREDTPKDANGQYDFEALEAMDTKKLSADLKRLITGEEVQLPRYNFREGKQEAGDVVKISKEHLIILEGIHGLDPRLLPNFPPSSTFKIYASCLTQLNLDRYNRISTTDTRLIRRIVRDSRERGYSAQQTIGRWDSVTHGEKNYIFPYQENGDKLFNSALVYELSALKGLVEPLLRQVPYGSAEYMESKRLLAMLEWFLPLDNTLIPDNSLMREFIGGSILSDFKLWEQK